MKRPKTLSPSFVKAVSAPGRYGDGRGSYGLSLLVKGTSTGRMSKSWSQRLVINGRIVMIGLGAYPVISLAQARAAALVNKQAMAGGRDPRNAIPTFEQSAETVITMHAAGWKDSGKSAGQWRACLRDYVYPRIGDKRINAIDTSDLLAVLLPVWHDKPETARRVKQRIGAIMKWAVAESFRDSDPTTSLSAALPKHNGVKQHHRALPHADVSGALETVQASGAYATTRLAFEFMVLTAARSGEIRAATWDEIDSESATWTIPAGKMKNKRAHRVPLSAAALAVLEKAGQYADRSDLVFPSITGRQMSDNTLSKLLRDHGVGCVPHGMRSSFRNWAAECTTAPREIAEMCLAHVEGNAAELAYRRTDYFELRRELMSDWAAYVLADNVIPMRASG